MSTSIVSFEDIKIGATFTSTRRTITDADILAFAGLSGDFNPIHIDDVHAKEGPFGRRVAHGLLTVAVGDGMRCEIDNWDGVVTAGVTRRFVHPVFPGDTIHCEYTVRDSRPSSSQPDRGVITVVVSIVNSVTGQVVITGENVSLVRRAHRPQHGDSAPADG